MSKQPDIIRLYEFMNSWLSMLRVNLFIPQKYLVSSTGPEFWNLPSEILIFSFAISGSIFTYNFINRKLLQLLMVGREPII